MKIIHPSELPGVAEGAPCHVAGRVRRAESTRVWLADAFATAEIRLAQPGEAPGEGDLVRVVGVRRAGRVVEARVERIEHACPGPRADSRRFTDAGTAARLRERAAVIAEVRAFFVERGYLEVDTPALVPAPGLDLHLDAFSVAPPVSFGRGERRGALSTSPELQMKRLLVGGLPRIFQLARCFRAGEQGSRHNPEFTMLEWYRAQASYAELMDETEALVRGVLAHFSPEAMPLSRRPVDVRRPFARLTVAEAFERFAGLDADRMARLAESDEDRYFRLLVERVEPGLAELGVPVFVHRYPASQCSLARLAPDDPRFCERFELYVGDVELCNGFGELTDPDEQRRRFEQDQVERRRLGKAVPPIDEAFLAALAEGMPPAAGNALGLDRLIALALGAANLREVMAFSADIL